MCQVICERGEREGVTGGATGGQRRGRMEGRRVRRDEGEEKKSLVRDRTDKRGKCVRWGRKRKISVVSPHHPARAEWSTVCVGWATGGRVRDGQPSSPFKKKKEEGICNSSLIKIIVDQPRFVVAPPNHRQVNTSSLVAKRRVVAYKR